MARETTPITVDADGSEHHPSFGTMSLHTYHSTGTHLFQSDLSHDRTVVLQINRASRQRSGSSDAVHVEKQLVQVEMSMAQWGAFVSSTGLGSGVPITLRQMPEEPVIPEAPHQARLQHNVTEVTGAVETLLETLTERTKELAEAIEQKKGIRAIREALRTVQITLANAPSNAGFAVSSLHRAVEETVAGAKADIEAHVLQAQRQTGQSSINPVQPALQLRSSGKADDERDLAHFSNPGATAND